MSVSPSSAVSVISLAKVGTLCLPTDIDITETLQAKVLPRMDKSDYLGFETIKIGESLLSFSVDIEEIVNAKIWMDKDEAGKTFYVCTECNYSQKLRKDVAKHVERRHLNLSIPCPYLCGNTFSSRTELRTHIKSKHETLNAFGVPQTTTMR